MYKVIAKKIFMNLPYKYRDIILFYRIFGRFPNVSNPVSFNEKVLYRKHTSCVTDESYSVYADKYLVRELVSSKIGEEFLIPLHFVTDDAESLKEWIRGKSNIVIKPNHGAGMVRLVTNIPTEEEVCSIQEEADKWLKTDFAKLHAEPHYSKIERKIIVEEKLGSDLLIDYKIHMFRDAVGCVFYILQIIEDRFVGELNRTFYINNLDSSHSGHYVIKESEKKLLTKAISLSSIVIERIEYARVDWYICDGVLYFGEVTLTPSAGFGPGYGEQLEKIMGEKWDLSLAGK